MPDDHASLLHYTAEIMKGFLQSERISVDQLPGVINQVHQALSRIGQPGATEGSSSSLPLSGPSEGCKAFSYPGDSRGSISADCGQGSFGACQREEGKQAGRAQQSGSACLLLVGSGIERSRVSRGETCSGKLTP